MEINKDEKIKELESLLEQEKMVKKGEVVINEDLRIQIEKKDLHIATLIKINEEFSNKISELRFLLKKIIEK
jgi:phosphotransferase system IIA component